MCVRAQYTCSAGIDTSPELMRQVCLAQQSPSVLKLHLCVLNNPDYMATVQTAKHPSGEQHTQQAVTPFWAAGKHCCSVTMQVLSRPLTPLVCTAVRLLLLSNSMYSVLKAHSMCRNKQPALHWNYGSTAN